MVASNLRLELDRPYFAGVSVDLYDLSENGITFFLRDLSQPEAPLQTAQVSHEVNRFIHDGDPLRLGSSPDKQAWDGLIARLRLDAARLTLPEIEAGVSSEPVLDWRFDDPDAIAHDASGRGHHAHVSVGPIERLSPREWARVALIHALLNDNELLYLD